MRNLRPNENTLCDRTPLLQFRLRGLHGDSGWLKPGQGLSVLVCFDEAQRSQAAAALASLNSLLPCCLLPPFASYDCRIKQLGYWRQVKPGKFTPVIGIFVASPQQIQKLAQVSSLLYEVDRIEVGRRLDHSRWFNFVELPSSSRYREVRRLLPDLDKRHRLTKQLSLLNLSDNDRIQGELARELGDIFTGYQGKAGHDGYHPVWQELFTIINRASDFQQARVLLPKLLPLTIHLNSRFTSKETTWFRRQEERLKRLARRSGTVRLARQLEMREHLSAQHIISLQDSFPEARGPSMEIVELLVRAIRLGILCRGVPPLLIVETGEGWWSRLGHQLPRFLQLAALTQIILVTDRQDIPPQIREQATLLATPWH